MLYFVASEGLSKSVVDANVSFESDGGVEKKAVPENRNQRGKSLKWNLLKKFESEKDAITFLKAQKTWSRKYTHDCSEGEKVYYRCTSAPRKGPQCKANLYLLRPHTTTTCELRSSGDHTHNENTEAGIKNDAIRAKVLLLAKGHMKPIAIRDQLLAEFPEAIVPKIVSIRNLLNRKNLTRNNESVLSIGEMIRWIEKNMNIPETDLDAFVLNYECSEIGANDRFMRFIMTSKSLLRNGTRSHIIHIDATYKLIWNGFPVLVLGTSDKNRQFHLLAIGVSTNETQADYEFMLSSLKAGIEKHLNQNYAPSVLVSDAAAAIANAFNSIFPESKNIKVM